MPEDTPEGRYRYLLVEAALSMLRRLIKQAPASWRAPEADAHALLDPLLPLLARALRSRHAGVTGSSLHCISSLLRFHLPGAACTFKMYACTFRSHTLLSC